MCVSATKCVEAVVAIRPRSLIFLTIKPFFVKIDRKGLVFRIFAYLYKDKPL